MNPHYNVKSRVLAAFAHMLAPLVRILIRNGISFYEFAEVAKETYVKVCEKDFVTADQRMTNARIAILTGLTRKDVATVLASDTQHLSASLMADAVARVLQGWHEDKDFLGPYGVPRSLFFESDPAESPTFADLAKRYREDMPPDLVLDILMRSGAVVRDDGQDTLQVTRRYVLMDSHDPGTFDWYANTIRQFIETSEANIGESGQEKRFQRWVFPDDGIRVEDWEEFSRIVKERLESVIDDLDGRFAMLAPPIGVDQKRIAVGVGLYVYRDKLS